ncbi:MAG: polysaccharide biosynthesis/export family protein, partial [Pseudomonadota bacterium]
YKVIDQDSKYLAELQQDQSYVIGCGDRLRVTVWGDDKLTTEPVVRPDGNISFPLIGDIQAKGLTVEDLKKELNRRLTSYINEPNVSVAVTDIKSFKIYVLGEVLMQGEKNLASYTDVLQAISLAGGFTIYAKKNSIQILRTYGGEKTKFKFDYDQVVRGKNLNQNISMKPGDVIIVP